MDSNRVVNLMAADVFFNRKITKRICNRVEKERFTLQPDKAKKYVKKYDKKYAQKYAKKDYKRSTTGIEFTERQLEIAIAAMKGKL